MRCTVLTPVILSRRKRVMIGSDLLRGLLVLSFIGASAARQLAALCHRLRAGGHRHVLHPRSWGDDPPAGARIGAAGRQLAGPDKPHRRRGGGHRRRRSADGVSGSVWPAFTIDALTFFASVLLVSRITASGALTGPRTQGHPSAIFGQLKDGLQGIAGSRLLTGTMLALAVTMLGLGAVNVLRVPLLINDLRVPATWFGAIEFAQTASMVLSGGLVAVLASRLRPASIVSGCLILAGILTGLIAGVSSVWHMRLILFAIGWIMTPLQASIAPIMQTSVEDRLRGRIGAALNTVISAASLLSLALAGVAGQFIGIRNVFLVGGIITVLAGLAAVAMCRTVRSAPVSETAEPAIA